MMINVDSIAAPVVEKSPVELCISPPRKIARYGVTNLVILDKPSIEKNYEVAQEEGSVNPFDDQHPTLQNFFNEHLDLLEEREINLTPELITSNRQTEMVAKEIIDGVNRYATRVGSKFKRNVKDCKGFSKRDRACNKDGTTLGYFLEHVFRIHEKEMKCFCAQTALTFRNHLQNFLPCNQLYNCRVATTFKGDHKCNYSSIKHPERAAGGNIA